MEDMINLPYPDATKRGVYETNRAASDLRANHPHPTLRFRRSIQFFSRSSILLS